MPTPMYVYHEIANRYGINPNDRAAVDFFFSNIVQTLPQADQIAIFNELLERDGERASNPNTKIKTTKQPDDQAYLANLRKLDVEFTNPSYVINVNLREKELEKENLELKEEIKRLTVHKDIAKNELLRIKEGIRKGHATMIIDGNDMYDWGWMTIQEVNSECFQRWGCLLSSKPTIPELQSTIEQLQKDYPHLQLFIDHVKMKIDARPITDTDLGKNILKEAVESIGNTAEDLMDSFKNLFNENGSFKSSEQLKKEKDAKKEK